ncbi:6067_t:CDS:10 [Diversispora eburnea]|uniref:ATP-dependent DNA helicase II subunit 1 n=1 Tax=Diversispora eburnea TaxID=1213867 RepID=A0A9N8V0T1_9GLOM|nr:6067_t:CDS:10 [Diversispora eburnea]
MSSSTTMSSWSSTVDDQGNRDAVLFVIDCSTSMMNKDENGDSAFHLAIQCASSIMMNKIISENSSDFLGVMFIGTEKNQNPLDKKHIYVLQNMDLSDIHRVMELNNIQEYGITDEQYPLGDVFWVCSELFNSVTSPTVRTKRIFLITNEDNPHSTKPVLRSAAITRARDLIESKIEIDLFSIDKPDSTFNLHSFYWEILSTNDEFDDFTHINTSKSFEALRSRIISKESPKRSIFSVPFHLFEGEVQERKKPNYKWVHMRGETTQLLPQDIKHYVHYGGEKIVFTTEELQKIKEIGEKGITLLGFKPETSLKPHYNMEHPYFLYPDEEQYEGSRRTFAALHQKMIEMKKVAICVANFRHGVSMKFVALKAEPEVLDDEGQQIHPPGFYMFTLPFADDLRPLPPHSTITPAPDTMIDFTKPIIEKLQIKGGYNPIKFPNPTLARFYDVLIDLALDQDIKEEIQDETLPKYGLIEKRVGECIKIFNVEANEQANNLYTNFPSSPPKQLSTTRSRGPKSQFDISTLHSDDKLNKATVAQLKEFLSGVGIKPASRKDDLIKQ